MLGRELAKDGGDRAPGGIVVPVKPPGEVRCQVQAMSALGWLAASGRIADDGLAG
jgi:hypothetical protein